MLLLVIQFWVKLIDFAICGHSLLTLKTLVYSCHQCYNVKATQNNTQSRTYILLAVYCNIQTSCTVLLILHNVWLKYRTVLTRGGPRLPTENYIHNATIQTIGLVHMIII